MALGERIRQCRQRMQLSQEKVAEMMGVTRQAVTKWESEQSAPSTENLFKLAEIFGTTTDFLLEVKLPKKEPVKTETFCGKSCKDCEYKYQLQCPGCKSGPGAAWRSDCHLAKCCKDKGLPACQSCDHAETCRTLGGLHRIPEDRLKRKEAEAARKKKVQESNELLGEWLWVLFWLVIPNSLASLLTDVSEAVPFLQIPGVVLSFVCALAVGWIYLKLRSETESYRTAGVCQLIFAGGLVVLGVLESVTSSSWVLLIQIPTMIVGGVGAYHECSANAFVLNRLAKVMPIPQAEELADKWETLWKWQIGLVGAMASCIVLIFILPGLATLVMLAGVIGSPVISILRLVYQYKTAKIFRNQMPE